MAALCLQVDVRTCTKTQSARLVLCSRVIVATSLTGGDYEPCTQRAPAHLCPVVSAAAMATKIATMRTLKPHPNMLQLHDVFEDEEGFHVVLEYCKGAALLEQIHNRVRPWALSCTF